MRKRVWFHRARAIAWVIIGAASYPLGWANSVAVVWTASLYANIMTDWGAAEAADEHEIMDELQKIHAKLDQLYEFKMCPHHGVISDHAAEERDHRPGTDEVPLGDCGRSDRPASAPLEA